MCFHVKEWEDSVTSSCLLAGLANTTSWLCTIEGFGHEFLPAGRTRKHNFMVVYHRGIRSRVPACWQDSRPRLTRLRSLRLSNPSGTSSDTKSTERLGTFWSGAPGGIRTLQVQYSLRISGPWTRNILRLFESRDASQAVGSLAVI